MNRHANLDSFPLLLIPVSFVAAIATWIFAFLDALEGSAWCASECAFAFACSVSFVLLLTSEDLLCGRPIVEHGSENNGTPVAAVPVVLKAADSPRI